MDPDTDTSRDAAGTATADPLGPDDRPLPPRADERACLTGFLALNRATVIRKARGLSDADAARRVLPSLTSISGVLRHLADVERSWTIETMEAGDYDRRFGGDEDPDGEWRVEPTDPLAEIVADYEAACAESDAVIARHDLDDIAAAGPPEEMPSMRWIVVHLIEETARHAGHADVVRELLDGVTGE
jgi:uncharacterized damage-inducible protein DinB